VIFVEIIRRELLVTITRPKGLKVVWHRKTTITIEHKISMILGERLYQIKWALRH